MGPSVIYGWRFIAEHKDLILDDLALDVVHEDGERRALRWSGAKEDLGETRDAAGVKQGQLTKEHPLTALSCRNDRTHDREVCPLSGAALPK